MKKVYLIAEENLYSRNDLANLQLFENILEKEAEIFLGIVQSHIFHDTKTDSDLKFLDDFAILTHTEIRKTPLPQIFKRRRMYETAEKVLNGDDPEGKLLDEYAEIVSVNLDRRIARAIKDVNDMFSQANNGSTIYVCDYSMARKMKEKLSEQGYKVELHYVREPLELTFTKGNALNSLCDVLAHGVAEGQKEDMKTGIAKEIWERWPETYERFKRGRRTKRFKLGDVIIDTENRPMIAYLATQPDLMHANPGAVNKSLRKLRQQLEKMGTATCALPRIGCGYGKLDWEDIKRSYHKQLDGSTIRFLVYDNDSNACRTNKHIPNFEALKAYKLT